MLSDPTARAQSLVSPAASPSLLRSVPLRTQALEAGEALVPLGWTSALARLLALAFLVMAAEALFAVPKLTWDLATGSESAVGTVLGIAITAFALAVLWATRHRIAALLAAAGNRLAAIPRGRWLAALIAAGIAARVVWALLFPAPFTSDGEAYYKLAQRLSQGLTYQTTKGEWVAWPPGYPFLLLVHFKLLGVGRLAVAVANLLLFAGSLLTVDALARRFSEGREGTARLATLLLALWPNLIASAGVASKEMVIVFLLPATLLLYLGAVEKRTIMSLAAGLVLGYAILTQPALQLLAGIFLVFEVLLRTPVLRAAARLALLGLGMAVVILPWTWRNYQVTGVPVLVSANGGSVFYRANNPLATGGWILQGERSLAGYDELTADRLGYQWGKEWIRENPGPFLRLALKKQILFLGDDATGLYEIKRAGRIEGGVYSLLKLLTNAWWWGIWALALTAFLVRRSGTGWERRADVVLFLMTVLYFWAIDSVFESGARHHLPLVGLLAVMAGTVSTGAGGLRTKPGQSLP